MRRRRREGEREGESEGVGRLPSRMLGFLSSVSRAFLPFLSSAGGQPGTVGTGGTGTVAQVGVSRRHSSHLPWTLF